MTCSGKDTAIPITLNT